MRFIRVLKKPTFSRAVAKRPLLASAACILLLAVSQISSVRAQPPTPPPVVVVAKIEEQAVGTTAEFVARVEAIESVDIRARVEGFLESVLFRGGEMVEAGQPLFQIERDHYEARLASARAQAARAEATLIEMRDTLARRRELRERGTIAQAALDEAVAAHAAAEADLAAASATIRTAELDLGYTEIKASIDGRIGRPLITRGNLVVPDSGPLARIVQLDPIRVVFALTEGEVVNFRQARIAGGQRTDAADYLFKLRLPNGDEYPHPGTIEFIDSEVDPSTGTIGIRAVYANPDDLLVPGQNVTVQVAERAPPRLPVVPQSAVQQDREGRYVYMLEADETVSQRRIAIGHRTAGGWAVTEGLKPGDAVVVQGIQRLRPGIEVRPTLAPQP